MDFGLSQETLCLVWFGILGLLLAGYAILDGFDLGVGILHPFLPRSDEDRRIAMNSIGPLWDGNEVWLVVFGGALFAMFPEVYAAVFSGFYTLFMMVLFALIFRAVSFDFRSKVEDPRWRRLWDTSFSVGSAGAAFLFGVAIANLLRGVPLTERGDIVISLAATFNPYAVLVGLMVLSLFAMHGSLFLYFKTEGELHTRVQRYIWRTFGLFMAAFMLTTIFTLGTMRHVTRHFEPNPILWLIPMITVLCIANIPRAVYHQRAGEAFLSSALTIAALVSLLGAALFPDLLLDSSGRGHSVSIYDAASSTKTLTLGLLFVLIGMPFVLAYSGLVYWIFRGKVQLEPHSY